MSAGEKRRVWLPQALAFGKAVNRPSGTLVMDLELVAFEPSPFKAPPDVAGPGDGAQLLPSGLALKVLRPGQGTVHPSRSGWVTVQYSGWTTDGKLFDSSWKTGQPATLRLDEVVKGWTEGLKLMVPGEKTRFWVPQKLAYQGQEGMPAGMLVFDIELLETGK
jgi:peptidylprolyl isomerase